MGGFRPIGSEKLEGMDKIKRIMEIARYNENIPQSINETKSTEYSINFADGVTYQIEKERQGYIIKKSVNESESDYIDNIKSRKYYSSYSQALKRLNLMAKEINVLHENEEGISLIGEQKKKFILKTKKKTVEDPSSETSTPPEPAAEPTSTLPEPDSGIKPNIPPPSAADEPSSPPDFDETDDSSAETPPDLSALDEPTSDIDGSEEDSEEPDMGIEDDEEIDVETEKKPKEKKISDLKRIQILVGKLAQKIRTYEEEKELSPKEIKYIINSILSAIDVEVLDEDDIEQIIDKLEGTDEEDSDDEDTDEEEVSFDEKEVAPEPPSEPEMAEGYNNLNDAFDGYLKGAFASQGSKALSTEMSEEDNYRQERRKRHFYPAVDSFEHGTFSESTVDKVLSKYFILNEEEEQKYSQKKDRKTNESYKINKRNIIKLSESTEQLDTALDYIRENPRVKLLGLSDKGNLIFKEGISQVKITKKGKFL